ncbi:MAG: hypothetical protein ACHQYP_01950 [Nitrospiria bacterium]
MEKQLQTFLVSIAAGLIGGIGGETFFAYHHPPSPPIAVVDVKKILQDHQDEIAKAYPVNDLTEPVRQKIIQDARDFAFSLSDALNQVGAGKTLLVKDAVIGHSPDLTREVNDQIAREIARTKQSRPDRNNTGIGAGDGK